MMKSGGCCFIFMDEQCTRVTCSENILSPTYSFPGG